MVAAFSSIDSIACAIASIRLRCAMSSLNSWNLLSAPIISPWSPPRCSRADSNFSTVTFTVFTSASYCSRSALSLANGSSLIRSIPTIDCRKFRSVDDFSKSFCILYRRGRRERKGRTMKYWDIDCCLDLPVGMGQALQDEPTGPQRSLHTWRHKH